MLMHHNDPTVQRLVAAADMLGKLIDSGEIFDGIEGREPARQRTVDAIDELQQASDGLHRATQPAGNPFATYRAEILGHYSTAQRLATLVLHLFNGNNWVVDLPTLLGCADERHVQIALECMDWYGRHGENCQVFMALAREILRRDHPELCDE